MTGEKENKELLCNGHRFLVWKDANRMDWSKEENSVKTVMCEGGEWNEGPVKVCLNLVKNFKGKKRKCHVVCM